MDKNFGLTQEQFDQLLTGLQNGNSQLFERVFLKHFQDCMNYLKRNYRASHEDAYDVTMDTLLVFNKRMEAGKVSYGNLRFLFTQMAGQHYKRWIKKEGLTEELSSTEAYEIPQLSIEKEDMQIFDRAWEILGQNCKILLKAFYYENRTLNDLAKQSDKNPAAIRKQKQRCMEKLRASFKQLSNLN